MLKFYRTFELSILDVKSNQTTIVTNPLRVVFDAQKSIFGGLNTLNMQIYNLKKENSQAFLKDPEQQKVLRVTLKVGYQDRLETLFIGDVFRGFVGRQNTDIVNSLQIIDGGQGGTYGYVSQTVKTRAEVNATLIQNMPGVTRGTITQQSELIRPRVLVGNCNKIFQQQLNPSNSYFIDNGEIYILNGDEYLANYISVVSPETGLINTPQRENSLVSFETIMNPVMKLGGLVDLQSTTASYLNGIYRVQQIVTKGDNYGQDWKQVVTCQLAEGFKKI